MASSLQDFLAVKVLNKKEKTISVTAKDGSELEIDIQSLPIDQIKRIRAQNTLTYPTPQGGIGTAELDTVGYTVNMAVAGVKVPNLKDVQLLQKFDAVNAEEVLVALFSITEIAKIAGEVEDLSVGDGQIINGTDPKKVEEAKNS